MLQLPIRVDRLQRALQELPQAGSRHVGEVHLVSLAPFYPLPEVNLDPMATMETVPVAQFRVVAGDWGDRTWVLEKWEGREVNE